MTPDVVLLADAGPDIGWGHAMRMYALAEALVERRKRVLFVTRTREAAEFNWPCPVHVVDGWHDAPFSERSVVDIPAGETIRRRALMFYDYGELVGEPEALVAPHFGARPNGAVTFAGPRWMPLRSPFHLRVQTGGTHPRRGRNVLVYVPDAFVGEWGRLMHDIPNAVSPMGMDAESVAALMRTCRAAVVPPSTIAYECMAMGLPVFLYVPHERYEPIAEAMWHWGVAGSWGDVGRVDGDPFLGLSDNLGHLSKNARRHVDGMGAHRLAEWLT